MTAAACRMIDEMIVKKKIGVNQGFDSTLVSLLLVRVAVAMHIIINPK